jgi:hypothetical protein
MSHVLEAEKQLQPSGDHAIPLQREKVKNVAKWAAAIAPLKKIISDINAQLHMFADRVLIEAQFSDTSKTIFERYQTAVDRALANHAFEAFSKLPHVFERLSNGDPEAISHAMTSCRRIIDGFANSVFPARTEPVSVRGQNLDCAIDKTKNRIRAYIASKITSDSRYERMNRNLGSLYDRVSAGVHSEVTVEEAQALVLNTYLLLGEIVSLP